MENISYIGLSRQMALHEQMDIVANNIANMDTPGFKSQNMVFTEYLTAARGADPVSMVLDYGTYRNLEQGALTQTKNPLDLALNGDGYFAVETADGVRYTRAGNFMLNADRQIVTSSGNPVQGDGGGPLVVPAGENRLSITGDGAVSTENGEIGQIKVVRFDDPHELKPVGGGLYRTEQAELPAEETAVLQGMLEKSNVQPVIEMNRMIDILRNYQNTQRLLQTDHERQRSVIQRLSQIQ